MALLSSGASEKGRECQIVRGTLQTHPQSTCAFVSIVVTHIRTTLTQPVQHLVTQTQTIPATSTSSTSVLRETSPATSPEVPLTRTFPSSFPVTSASSASSLSSTQLGTSYPGKAPSCCSACFFQFPPFSPKQHVPQRPQFCCSFSIPPCYCHGTLAGPGPDPHMILTSSLQLQGFGSGTQASLRVQASVSSCPTATNQTQAEILPPSSYSAALRMHSGPGVNKWQGNWKHISNLQFRTVSTERHNPRHHLLPKDA